MAYGIPSYADPNEGGYAPAGAPSGLPTNQLIMALSKGLMGRGKNDTGSMLGTALKRYMAKPGGSGLTVSQGQGLTPNGLNYGVVGDGQGVLNTAMAAGTGSAIATRAPSMADQAAGNPNGDPSAGGFLTSKGGEPGADMGGGSGLQTTTQEGGLKLGENDGFGYDQAANDGTGSMTVNGEASSSSGGSWGGAVTGAVSGVMQGDQNYNNDPNMWSGKDGFGKHHTDYRAHIGGGTVGGLLGYFGGPLGSAVAAPVVEAIHPYGEALSRYMVNTGDSVGDSAGAMLLEPVATPASGKYSNEQIAYDWARYSLMGGLAKFVK